MAREGDTGTEVGYYKHGGGGMGLLGLAGH